MGVCEKSKDKYIKTTCSKDGGFSTFIYDDQNCQTITTLADGTELKDETAWGECYSMSNDVYYMLEYQE